MQNENDWYWNLNLHRNEFSLVSSSSIANDPAISSNLYTTAVLNDNGIYVGMRNAHLKDAHFSCFHRPQKIPNCCSNQNVVGQRNQQIWETTFPTMENYLTPEHGCQPNFIIHPNELQCAKKLIDIDDQLHARAISAETNPFHLFGNHSTPLSSFKLFDRECDFLRDHFSHPMHFYDSSFNLYQPSPINYANRNDQKNAYAPIAGTPIPADTSGTQINTRISENEKNSDCVAPPKKKWIKNYMQSNFSFLIIQFPNSFIIFTVVCIIQFLLIIRHIRTK